MTEDLSEYVENIKWLEERDLPIPTEDEMKELAEFRANLEWLEDNGHTYDDESMKEVAEHVSNINFLEERDIEV